MLFFHFEVGKGLQVLNMNLNTFHHFLLWLCITSASSQDSKKDAVIAEEDTRVNLTCQGGTFLSQHICLPKGYDKKQAPNDTVVIWTDFSHANFREVDDKKMTITFDILLSYTWIDDRITKKFLYGIAPISHKSLETIWKPGVYIENIKSYRQRSSIDKLKLEQLHIFNYKVASTAAGLDANNNHTFVGYRLEAQITLYCNFVFDTYPLDKQICSFKLGSSNLDEYQTVGFKHLDNGSYCLNKNTTGANGNAMQDFEVETNCYQTGGSDKTLRGFVTKEDDWVAFNITLTRIFRPLLMKYYLPSMAIVVSSQISFLIPMSAIPARTALLATLFLSLVNIFSIQQVILKLFRKTF